MSEARAVLHDRPLTHYIVVHYSLKNHMGALAAQTAHAAAESIFELPVPPDTYVVTLEAPTADSLVLLSDRLKAAGIRHVLIREPDVPYNGSATAVGIEPQPRENVRAFVDEFKVLR